MKNIYTKLKALAANALIAALVLTNLIAPQTLGTSQVHAANSAPVDYIADKFDGVDTGHVFDVVTAERLLKGVLERDGKSIIVLGSPKNETTKVTLRYINDVAKSYGVKKIYFFDPNVGGELGGDITTTSWDYKAIWTALTTYYSESERNANGKAAGFDAGAGLKYIDQSYTSDDTEILVYDRKAGGDTIVDSQDTILSELLIKKDDLTALSGTGAIDAFKATVETVLSAVGGKNSTTETTYNDYDFFVSAYGQANPKIDTYVKDSADFRLVSITLPELLHILDTQGTHNIFISGSWCPDSRRAIGFVSENAAKYSTETVYNFDFRLGPTAAAAGGMSYSIIDTEGATAIKDPAPTGRAWLGAEIIKRITPYISGTGNVLAAYHPGGVSTEPLVENAQRNFRSPFLIKYQKNGSGKGEVLESWVHTLKDYELPYKQESYGSSAPMALTPGAYLDYEFNSGPFTQAQIAAGRAAIGSFFGGPLPSAPSVITPRVDKVDNGCGDSNDPLDNLRQDKLIPNQGTADYDVKHYDIEIAYNPAKNGDNDSITGLTKITAVASRQLYTISLDFRALAVDKSNVRIAAGSNNIAPSTITQVNVNELDKQKLNINLSAPIASGQEFTVTVPYTTGVIDNFVDQGESPQGFFKRVDGKGIAALGEPLGSTYWFPNNNTPSDGATYRVSLIGPSEFKKISSGKRVSESADKTVWEVTHDIAPYQVFAAFSDDYTELAQTVTLNDGTEISGLSFVNTTLYDKNENRYRDKVDNYYNKLPYYLRTIEQIAGSYPGESVGFVFDNLSDGTGTPASWGAVETQDRPFFTNTNVVHEGGLVHELAHQWYGNTVRIAKWEDLWLNEAFATYVSDLFYEKSQGIVATEKYKNLYQDTRANTEWWSYAPAAIEKESDLFGGASAAYQRGALALAALRVSVGDADFFKILQGWPQQYAGKAVTTKDFLNYAEEIANVNLDEFSKAWLYGKVKPNAFPTQQLPEGRGPKAFVAAPVPTISGTALVGKKLTAQAGKWDPVASFNYQWQRDGKTISGATGTTYNLTSADLGKKITVQVTGTRAGYTTIAKTSKATAKVTAAFTKAPGPKISGKVKVGKKLTVKVGTWAPKAGTKFTYQWYANGKKISKATKVTLTLKKAQKGKKITVKVTAKRANYVTVTKASKATSKVKK